MSLVGDLLSLVQSKPWDSAEFQQKLREISVSTEIIDNNAAVVLLENTALNHDNEVLSLLLTVLKVDINVQDDELFTVLHRLTRLNHPAVLMAIQFLLENGASFVVFDQELQTPFHSIMRYGSPENISAFWHNRGIWDWIRAGQYEFDTADKYGKKTVHYIMAREVDGHLNEVIRQYYRFRDMDSEDLEGNSPLHHAAGSGDIGRINVLMEMIGDSFIDRKRYQNQNHAGETPADVALKRGHLTIAGKLYPEEFSYSPIYRYLSDYFKKKQTVVSSEDIVKSYHEKILSEITRLSRTLKIPSSQLDETIRGLFQAMGIHLEESDEGFELPFHDELLEKHHIKDVRQVYGLTPIGKLEEMLRHRIVADLTSFIKRDDGLIKAREEEYDAQYARASAAYEEEMRDFEDGNYGYEYEGPIRPEPPDMGAFDVEQEREEIDEEFTEEVLNDVGLLLKHISVQHGLLGDMLYNDFSNMDLIEDVLQEMDFSRIGLDRFVVSTLLRNLDLQFPDVDVAKPGFLIEIFEFNLINYLLGAMYDFEIEMLVNQVILHLSDSPELIGILKAFNRTQDPLEWQKYWIKLSKIVDTAFEQRGSVDALKPVDAKRLASAKEEAKKKTDLTGMVKVFPTDNSDKLVYLNENGRGRNCRIEFPLRPVFKTLQAIAAHTHNLIVQAQAARKQPVQTEEKGGNVVTTMLCFVVSVSSAQREHPTPFFIQVPLTLDYPKILLSKDTQDKVFSKDSDLKQSAFDDRKTLSEIVEARPVGDFRGKEEEARQQMRNYIEIFYQNNPALKQQFLDQINTLEAQNPLCLEFQDMTDQKKVNVTEHSERVILYALKQRKNVEKIVDELRKKVVKAQHHTQATKYTILSANLILYSHPNSVCSECSYGFIALENSYEHGFLKLFIEVANQDPGIFETIGFKSDTAPAQERLSLRVFVASSKIYQADLDGQHIMKSPGAKLDLVVLNSIGSAAGIRVDGSSTDSLRYFYEFVDSQIHESQEAVPFSGKIAMSGSRDKKLGAVSLEEKLKAHIEEFNEQVRTQISGHEGGSGASTLLSLSNGHKVAAPVVGERGETALKINLFN